MLEADTRNGAVNCYGKIIASIHLNLDKYKVLTRVGARTLGNCQGHSTANKTIDFPKVVWHV